MKDAHLIFTIKPSTILMNLDARAVRYAHRPRAFVCDSVFLGKLAMAMLSAHLVLTRVSITINMDLSAEAVGPTLEPVTLVGHSIFLKQLALSTLIPLQEFTLI